jgi:hypothetical protein
MTQDFIGKDNPFFLKSSIAEAKVPATIYLGWWLALFFICESHAGCTF